MKGQNKEMSRRLMRWPQIIEGNTAHRHGVRKMLHFYIDVNEDTQQYFV